MCFSESMRKIKDVHQRNDLKNGTEKKSNDERKEERKVFRVGYSSYQVYIVDFFTQGV